jgi:very-short-patch-repair endonuclease
METREALVRLGGVADAGSLLRLTSRRKLRTALAAGQIVRDGRGRYALSAADEAGRAASRLSGVVSHASAAAYYGWASKWPAPMPSVTVPRKRRVAPARRVGVMLHWADLSAEERLEGVTRRVRTVLDCAKVLPFDEALAIADSAIRNDDVTNRELLGAAEELATTGRARCLRIAREADGRAHNPFESVLRAIALDVGLRLEPQSVVVDGARWIQPDLVDRGRRVVVEAESFAFHADRRALLRDCERYNELGRRGWTVYRFTWEHVMRRPAYVAEVLAAVAATPPGREN